MPQMIKNLIDKYVSEVQKIYGTHLRQVILYGLYARGDFKVDSDVDHFHYWCQAHPFYSNVAKEGVSLYEAA